MDLDPRQPKPPLGLKDFFMWLAIWSACAIALWIASTWLTQATDALRTLLRALGF